MTIDLSKGKVDGELFQATDRVLGDRGQGQGAGQTLFRFETFKPSHTKMHTS